MAKGIKHRALTGTEFVIATRMLRGGTSLDRIAAAFGMSTQALARVLRNWEFLGVATIGEFFR